MVFVLLGCPASVQALTCNGDGPCRCTYSDGSGTVDIGSVGRHDGKPQFPDESSYDGSFYSYNPCFPMSQGSCTDSACCKRVGNDYVTMGTQPSASWSYTGYYPMVSYSTSDGKVTEVVLMCDKSYTVAQIDVVGELRPGILTINMFSICACPNQCKRVDPPADDEGLSPGSIMLIIFFVLLIVYVVAGSAFNYHRQKTVGREMLPNYGFWSTIPGLAQDGFKLSWDCICRRNSGGAEYEKH
ncbi:hypothetical protein Btru_060627 [Bulinus truncatus]|nr:hypothetical protein Btru_060627 [Bulinus truncatus]